LNRIVLKVFILFVCLYTIIIILRDNFKFSWIYITILLIFIYSLLKRQNKRNAYLETKPDDNVTLFSEKNVNFKNYEEEKIINVKTLTTIEYKLPEASLINSDWTPESLKTFFSNRDFLLKKFSIPIGYSDESIFFENLKNLPHLLICGSLMTGKTNLINLILCSLIMKEKPSELEFIIIDFKRIELSSYNGIPHLLTPVITDFLKATIVLNKITNIIENRYRIFERANVNNITMYNDQITKYNDENNEKRSIISHILVIIDGLALMENYVEKDFNDHISNIIYNGENVGIHIILSVNSPLSKTINNNIIFSFPSKAIFRLTSRLHSKKILNCFGAEQLEDAGNILYVSLANSNPKKINIPYITDYEIKRIVDYAKSQQSNVDDLMLNEEENSTSNDAYEEPLYNEIVKFVIEQGKASTSLLQRKFRLGYNRAVRVIDLLEERGIVGQNNGSKPREVLVQIHDIDKRL